MKHDAHRIYCMYNTGRNKTKFGNRCIFRHNCYHLRINLRQVSSELIKLVVYSCFQKNDDCFSRLVTTC
jgi:hypothetical protein